ncbi:MAG: perosamine synthetase [Bradymonadia bacterium]|jgi:perosamine synthetase
MSDDLIPLAKPVFEDDDFEALRGPLLSGWVVQGPNVKAFEDAFATYTGAAHAIACTSATSALHLAMVALGVGPGDEVIVPAFTWVATANAVVYCGATPVFADIELATYNIDPADVARKITPKTKAIVPVHLFGLPADMDALAAFGLPMVEDAACGLDARIGTQHVGTFGELACFSFHPRKAVTTGEGGMLTTASPAHDSLLRGLRSHGGVAPTDGRAPFLMADFPHLGFNYRMTDLQGALGHTQMGKAARLYAARSQRAARYLDRLQGIDGLILPSTPDGMTHGWQSFICRMPEGRDAMMQRLIDANIQTRPGTHAVHALGWYRENMGTQIEDCPTAWAADQTSFAIPLFPTMTDAQQDRVIAVLRG